jgi:hypothetical protein
MEPADTVIIDADSALSTPNLTLSPVSDLGDLPATLPPSPSTIPACSSAMSDTITTKRAIASSMGESVHRHPEFYMAEGMIEVQVSVELGDPGSTT